MAEIRVSPIAYEVTAWPGTEESTNALSFALKVEYRGRGLWSVLFHLCALSKGGEWDYEPISSERTDEWLAAHRFPLREALNRAREMAPRVTVMGLTAQQVADWEKKQ